MHLAERNKLIEDNIGLLEKWATKMFRKTGKSPTYFYSIGAEALVKAADKFDVSKGYRFSTYAYTAFSHALERDIVINHSLTPSVKTNQGDRFKAVKHKDMFNLDMKSSDIDNISAKLNIAVHTLEEVFMSMLPTTGLVTEEGEELHKSQETIYEEVLKQEVVYYVLDYFKNPRNQKKLKIFTEWLKGRTNQEIGAVVNKRHDVVGMTIRRVIKDIKKIYNL
jgi:RNA polymerase primary sigma factor